MKGAIWIFTLMVLSVCVCMVITGCSSDQYCNPSAPVQFEKTAAFGSRCNWGLWQFIADPQSETLEIVQLRSGNMHLNALPFLEPPALAYLTLESLQFNGDIIDADIGLRHPFIGLTEFTGFDVCGILISNGSITGFNDPDLKMTGDGDTRLLNPDGLSRWWNPSEFPVNNGTIFSYNDGLLGTPYSVANFNCTLNGYKYFADGLDPDDLVSALNQTNRGMFSAGQKNVRHYTIEMSDGLIFNYAVDANWKIPSGSPPFQAPEDFPPGANRAEAWRISVTETENTLWNDGVDLGGDLILQVDVYDWFNADLNTVRVESPGNFNLIESSIAAGGGAGYSTYEVEIIDATPAQDKIELLVSIISDEGDFEGFIPGTNTTAYFTYTAGVAPEPYIQPSPCKNISLRDDALAVDIAVDHNTGDLFVLYEDKMLYRYEKADCFETGWLFAPITDHLSKEMYAVDIAPNQYVGIALSYVTTVTPGLFIYDPDGGFVQYAGQGPPAGPMEAYAMPGGSYQNDIGFVRGRLQPYTEYPQTIVLRLTKSGDTFVYGNVYDFIISDGNTFGYDRVCFEYIKGAESNADGDLIWLLEDPDYYAARWELATTGAAGHLIYNNAYIGTGAQTEDDEGWYNGHDITRDNQDRIFVLDELENGEPRIKVWSVNGNITQSLGNFGDSSTINGKPLRIEGSDFDGDIYVLHGDTLPSMVSVFNPDEMPGD